MRTIGIRQLRQHASRYLRLVQEGQTMQVTDRGRAIALLVPVPDASLLEQMIAQGRADLGVGDVLDLGVPLPPRKGVQLPGDILAGARDQERE